MNNESIGFDFRYRHSNYLKRSVINFKKLSSGIATILNVDQKMHTTKRKILDDARMLLLEVAEECRIGMLKSKAREESRDKILQVAISTIQDKFSKLTLTDKFVFIALKNRDLLISIDFKNQCARNELFDIEYKTMLDYLARSVRKDHLSCEISISKLVEMELEDIEKFREDIKNKYLKQMNYINEISD